MNNNALMLVQEKIAAFCKGNEKLKEIRGKMKLNLRKIDVLKQKVINLDEECDDGKFLALVNKRNNSLYEKIASYRDEHTALSVEYNIIVMDFCKANIAKIETIEKMIVGCNVSLNEHNFMAFLFNRDYLLAQANFA